MGWNDYGFPNPLFRSKADPWRAVIGAFHERHCIQNNLPKESSSPFSQYMLFRSNPIDICPFISSRHTMPHYSGYLNHLDIESIDISGIAGNPSEVYWTEPRMVAAMEDRDIYGINGMLTGHDKDNAFLPDFPIKYLQQLKLQANLMKMCSFPLVDVVTARGSGAYKSSPQEAYESAISSATTVTTNGVHLMPSSNTFNNSTTIYRYSSSEYYCTFRRILELKVCDDLYPKSSLPSFVYIRMPTIGSGSYFDPYGTGITYSDKNIRKFPLPYKTTEIIPPEMGIPPSSAFDSVSTIHINLSGGWNWIGVDCSPLFEFYENVDEIPTP
jgi:hypothetical protein